METGDLKRNFNQLLKSEDDIEKAYGNYTKLVDDEVNQSSSEPPTHQICWIERNALKEKLDQMTFAIAQVFSRPPHSPSRVYKFETSHALSEEVLADLQDAVDRGDQIETLTSFLAGIFFWLFFLSIPLLPVLGTTFIILPIISCLIFSVSVLRLSSARYRYLPSLFRSISADHWGIKSIQEIKS